jgi:metal-responsive CopG/Arc/MetJ family transcriptional regulator
MEAEARKLAQALLDSGERRHTKTFTITEGDRTSNEEVLIIAVRGDDREIKRLSESIKAVSGPSGTPCPMCNGTGKI